jgi:hypothetical protein
MENDYMRIKMRHLQFEDLKNCTILIIKEYGKSKIMLSLFCGILQINTYPEKIRV